MINFVKLKNKKPLMKKKIFYAVTALTCLMILNLYSCKSEINQKENTSKTGLSKDSTVTKKETSEQKNNLLDGIWISTEDEKSSVEIKSNVWTELYTGEKPESYKFSKGDTCLAGADSKSNPDGKYITVFDPDGNRCFFIVSLSESKLELSYVGRGNTLTYKKKK